MSKPALRTALIVAAYFVLSFGALQLLNFGPPSWVEQTISFLATPAVILLAIWTPALKPLGMVSGEWLIMPNALAVVLLVFAYAALAYVAALIVSRLLARAVKTPG